MRNGWIKRRLPWIAVAVVILGVINSWAFFIISIAIGGDALSGRGTDGRYFVMSHGTFTEVTHTCASRLMIRWSIWAACAPTSKRRSWMTAQCGDRPKCRSMR